MDKEQKVRRRADEEFFEPHEIVTRSPVPSILFTAFAYGVVSLIRDVPQFIRDVKEARQERQQPPH